MTTRDLTVFPEAALGGADHARAILNILEDFSAEKDRLADTQRAMLNILEDFSAEKRRLEATQKAMLNILDDFDAEKSKVERANAELVRENRERRQTERALTERSIELARSNADLEQFAYVASHDLQEPLRMVSSYVQLLERRYKGQLDPQADKYIGYAVEGARRMQGLIGGLLEYSRAGLDTAEPGRVSADASLDLALASLRSVFEESGAVLQRDPLPMVVVDGAQLAQVFQNLLTNAIKFRRPDAPPNVHVSAERRERECVISVRDHGIGLDTQYADRIFMIFQRLHGPKEYPGTGIGLAVCKKVIERNGGRIWVESTEGEGATFHFTLALAEGGGA
jgi:light-regulated signal transduction histidine kinase (bacteriophytochrome)